MPTADKTHSGERSVGADAFAKLSCLGEWSRYLSKPASWSVTVSACAARCDFRALAVTCSSTPRFQPMPPTPFSLGRIPTALSVRSVRRFKNFTVDGPCTVIDIGSGTGAGGLCVADLLAKEAQIDIILADINTKALRYSRVNAALNGVASVRTALSDVFSRINEGGNLIISNPPYLVDRHARAYRHGGGALGIDLALRIAEEGIERLYPGGRLFIYTGTPVISGIDQFLASVRPRLEARRLRYGYEEMDPDVFGEELDSEAYACVDRIAAVALTVDI